jgi:hypothetical protein
MLRPSDILHFLHDIFAAKPVLSDDELHWSEFCQSLPRGPFIMWLAGEIATELVCRARQQNDDLDQLIDQIGHGEVALQHDAEQFLQKQRIECDPTQVRRIIVFRHLLQLRLRHAK